LSNRVIGSFMSSDGAWEDIRDPGFPQSLHLYLLDSSNPISFSDPLGEFSIVESVVTAGKQLANMAIKAGPALRVYSVVSDMKDLKDTFSKVVNSEELDWGDYATIASASLEYLNPFKFLTSGAAAIAYRWFKKFAPIHGPLDNVVKDALRRQGRRVLQAAGINISSLEVHHRLPLEWAHLFPNAEPNRLANLVAYPPEIHYRVTELWRQFKDRLPPGAMPTQADVMKMVLRIEKFTGKYAVRAA
jgi:hypothetical protein